MTTVDRCENCGAALYNDKERVVEVHLATRTFTETVCLDCYALRARSARTFNRMLDARPGEVDAIAYYA